MIRLHFWPTPNGYKPLLFLEEAGIRYEVLPTNINKGDQFKPSFLAIAPNNRIPAIEDLAPATGGRPVTVFESGAILLYLAEKSGQFLGSGLHERFDIIQWLFWQMAGLGPMAGQNHHFSGYAPEKLPYAIDRFRNETSRLYAVLDRKLETREFIADTYSIADMACYPWIVFHERQGQNLDDFPNVKRWFGEIAKRPATKRSYEIGREVTATPSASNEEERAVLFGQSSATIRRQAP